MDGFFYWFGVLSFSLCALAIGFFLILIIYEILRTVYFLYRFKHAKTTRKWLQLYDSLKRDDTVHWWLWGPYPIPSRSDVIAGMRVMADEEEKGVFTCKLCKGEFPMSEARRMSYAYYCSPCAEEWEEEGRRYRK